MKGYKEAVSYIEGIPKFTKKHALSHTKECLRRLGIEKTSEKIVHIAGTNGKGSVCAFLEGILRKQGKKVGMFTSPHLVTIRERIRLQGIPISKEEFLQSFCAVYQCAMEMEGEGYGHPSYFEFLFLMGMKAFQKKELDVLLLEVGIGGRLDATNALENVDLSILTSIGLDHQHLLGNEIWEIAREKAGIFREGIPVIFDGEKEEVRQVILEEVKRKKCPYSMVLKKDMKLQEIRENKVAFLRVNAYDEGIYEIASRGIYQGRNLEIALQAATRLLEGEKQVEAWKEAVEEVIWPGRMEKVAGDIILDGAHNPPAIQEFLESISHFQEEVCQSVLIFSAVEDKDYTEMIQALSTRSSFCAFVVTEVEGERGVSKERLKELFQRWTSRPVFEAQEVETAIQIGRSKRGERGKVYIVGSLYLVGKVKKWIAGGNEDA